MLSIPGCSMGKTQRNKLLKVRVILPHPELKATTYQPLHIPHPLNKERWGSRERKSSSLNSILHRDAFFSRVSLRRLFYALLLKNITKQFHHLALLRHRETNLKLIFSASWLSKWRPHSILFLNIRLPIFIQIFCRQEILHKMISAARRKSVLLTSQREPRLSVSFESLTPFVTTRKPRNNSWFCATLPKTRNYWQSIGNSIQSLP